MALHRVPRGADRVTLPAPWLPEGSVEVLLRRDLSPAANMERMFKRARAFERAIGDIEQRLLRSKGRLRDLEGLAEELDRLEHLDGVEQGRWDAVFEQASALGLRLQPAQHTSLDRADKLLRRHNKGRARQLPSGVQRFETATGQAVLAGRNALANDALVTRLARGRDIWMHVRDHTGAHLVLRRQRREEAPDPTELSHCAMLVAHLTGLAKGERVEVTWTEAKHVRKAKGAPAGLVYISQGRTVSVRVDGAVVDAFYERRKELG